MFQSNIIIAGDAIASPINENKMKTVIMIDDDASILDIFKIVFERAGYVVMAYNNPASILEGGFEEPDIFIIDKQLRGADGADVCRFLKQREPVKTPP